MKKTIYYLGNLLIKKDSLPIKLIPKLKKEFPDINFVHLDPTEEFPLNKSQSFVLIDTVIGLDKVTKFNSLNHWAASPRISVHDFDLPVSLGILQKLGQIKKITIIGIPKKGKLKKLTKEVKTVFNT